MRLARYRFFLLPLFLVLACAGLYAQSNSEVTGIVTDQTGAVVPGAKVVLTDPATGNAKTVISSATGLYDIPGLNPSTYNLKVTAKGFEGYKANGIVVNVSSTARTDVKLTIGSVDQTVTIEADALAVQSDSNVISTLITSEDISELATENRNFAALAALGLGVTNNMPDSNSVTAVNASWAISFNGLNSAHNVWLIDGGESYDRGSGGKSALMPSQDGLAEFQVLASNYPPDYGISTGGTISMALKSGAQKFHGTLFEENRNTDYNANQYILKNQGQDVRVPTHFNIYGGNASGPLFIPKVYNESKQKTFFFWNEEWRKTTSPVGETNLSTLDAANIPNPNGAVAVNWVAAKFASWNGPVHVPNAGVVNNANLLAVFAANNWVAGAAIPNNNLIPASMMDPNAIKYLNSGIIQAATNNNDQVTNSLSMPTKSRDDILRIDHKINDKWQLMGHWINDATTSMGAQPQLGWLWASYDSVNANMSNPANGAVIKLSGTITPNLLLETSMNYDGNVININNTPIGELSANPAFAGWNIHPVENSFPLGGTDAKPRNSAPAFAGSNGFGAPYWTAEDTGVDPYHNAARDYEPKVDLSYSQGKHAFKFGFSYNRYTKNQILGGDTQGVYSQNAITNDGLLDLLLGITGSYSQQQSSPIRHWVSQTPSVYAMDNWHVTSRLSLQLGLRYDAMPHAWERNSYGSNFVPAMYNPSITPLWATDGTGTIQAGSPGIQTPASNGLPFYMNGMTLAGRNNTPNGLVGNDFKTLQPRVGFSEDVFGNGKTVLRGGFGTFYERIQGNDLYNADGNQPFAASLGMGNVMFSQPGQSWKNNSLVDPTKNLIYANGITSLATTYRAPVSAMYSLGVQHELAPSLIWVVQYVGNVDWHQNIDRGINYSPLTTSMQNAQWTGDGNCAGPEAGCTPAPAGFNANTLRTYAGYSGITQEENTATGNYNSFQTGLRVQNKWGLSGEADYTYSHQIDTTQNSVDLVSIDNPFNSKYDKGSGALDRRQQLSINYVYKLPFFNKDQGLVHSIAGGWEVAGTMIDNTGLPLCPTEKLNYDPTGLNGGYGEHPNVNGKVNYTKKYGEWFDTTQFSDPTPYYGGGPNLGFGSASKDAIVSPSRVNFSTSLYKTFAITERAKFQLKFESFNTFNHTEFNGVNTQMHGNSPFGTISSTWDPRNLQLGGKFSF